MDSASTAASPLASTWLAKGDVNFEQKEGFPNGLIEMKTAKGNDDPYVHLKDANFENGTIEFDVKPINDEWPTVRFRVHDENNAEEFYIRPNPNCAVAIDCLQYTPRMRGRMLWDSNYEYQRAAPFDETGWNHVKLVISGRRMNVYINRSAQPALVVDELEGAGGAGSIELQGPATFTNIVIAPGATEGLSAKPLLDLTANDNGYLRHWQMVGAQPLTGHEEPNFNDAPGAQASWTPIQAERLGLVNLARHLDRVAPHASPSYAWLKTTVHSDSDQVKQVSLGYLRVVTVFVNGQPVYSGKNLYNMPSERKQPDGRLGWQMATSRCHSKRVTTRSWWRCEAIPPTCLTNTDMACVSTSMMRVAQKAAISAAATEAR